MSAGEAFREQQRGVALRMLLALAITLGALAAAAAWAPGGASTAPVAERLQTALRADLFVVGWLAAAIANVARMRFFSRSDLAGSSAGPGSQPVRDAGAILQNTAEQVVLALAAHLVLAATLANPALLLAALVTLFCAGRALFWIGYGRGAPGRALGFALTFYPTLAALLIAAATLLSGRAA